MTPELLFGMALILGVLSFFEPCTIATHTLFSQRIHKKMLASPWRTLVLFWGVRSTLTAGLLLLADVLLPSVSWTLFSPAVPLLIIGSVYLFSRFVYLPIPHLEFYRLLPRWEEMSHGILLGLTLPACTIPLVIILLAASATLNDPAVSCAAGLLFGTAFAAVTVFTAFTGISSGGAKALSLAARLTPYGTAILLLGSVMYWFF